VEIGDVVLETGKRARDQNHRATENWRRARMVTLDAARSATSPEDAGYLAAVELRRSLGLDGQPVQPLPTVLQQVGVRFSHLDIESRTDRMVMAFCEGGEVVASTLRTRRTMLPWGQRFEAARALGHAVLDPVRAGTIGAASSPFAQETRRRRSGAFAAEFLLPDSAIAAASGGEVDGAAVYSTFERLLEQYGVGARTAAYHLYNRDWLSAAEVRDDLIDQFASLDEERSVGP